MSIFDYAICPKCKRQYIRENGHTCEVKGGKFVIEPSPCILCGERH